MTDTMQKLCDIGLVPLVVLEDIADAVPFARALCAGGIPVAEVTFRTEAAPDIIALLTKEVPELLVGAGTVHTPEQAQRAVAAGARFLVTPGFHPAVARWCAENKIDLIPGVVTPADIEQAMCYGLHILKFFPAEAFGGVHTLRAFAGPFAGIRFMPTGGVNLDNMTAYLQLPNVAAVGGSWMVPDKLIKAKDWDGITRLCQQSVLAAAGVGRGA